MIEHDNFSVACLTFIVFCNFIFSFYFVTWFLLMVNVGSNENQKFFEKHRFKGCQTSYTAIWIIICKKSSRLISILHTHRSSHQRCLRPATLLKQDSGTGLFLWVLHVVTFLLQCCYIFVGQARKLLVNCIIENSIKRKTRSTYPRNASK